MPVGSGISAIDKYIQCFIIFIMTITGCCFAEKYKEADNIRKSQQKSSASLSSRGLSNLLVVYVIWSSTYLAIRIAVNPQHGFSIWTAGAFRMPLAALILFVLTAISGYRLRLNRKELLVLLSSGLLLWVGGNGLLMWAEQRANSGFAALVLATTPIWVAIMEAILSKKLPSALLVISLISSFGGLFFLVAPSLKLGNSTEWTAGLGLVLGAFSWGLGSVIHSRYNLDVDPRVESAYQMLFAGLFYIPVSYLTSSHFPHVSHSAWLALAYLVVFGSVLGFASYIATLKYLPINIAMTYAFVNPILAVFLGWWLLKETITMWTLAGAFMVILGVLGVFWERRGQQNRQETDVG